MELVFYLLVMRGCEVDSLRNGARPLGPPESVAWVYLLCGHGH